MYERDGHTHRDRHTPHDDIDRAYKASRGNNERVLSMTYSTLCGKKIAPYYFCNNFVKPHNIFIIFGTQILYSKFATKLQQNLPPFLTTVLTLPCETKRKSICS